MRHREGGGVGAWRKAALRALTRNDGVERRSELPSVPAASTDDSHASSTFRPAQPTLGEKSTCYTPARRTWPIFERLAPLATTPRRSARRARPSPSRAAGDARDAAREVDGGERPRREAGCRGRGGGAAPRAHQHRCCCPRALRSTLGLDESRNACHPFFNAINLTSSLQSSTARHTSLTSRGTPSGGSPSSEIIHRMQTRPCQRSTLHQSAAASDFRTSTCAAICSSTLAPARAAQSCSRWRESHGSAMRRNNAPARARSGKVWFAGSAKTS